MDEINLLTKIAGYKRLKIFTIEEAAETLKTRPSTIKSLIKEGKLSAKKIGGRWILTENDLRKFLNLEEKE
jgi:excisionase family DNA binding protein